MAESEPQSACTAFVSGFKSKLTYFISTIRDINELLLSLEHKIRQVVKFAPTTKEHCYHYQHGTEYWIYHSFTKKGYLNMKIPG